MIIDFGTGPTQKRVPIMAFNFFKSTIHVTSPVGKRSLAGSESQSESKFGAQTDRFLFALHIPGYVLEKAILSNASVEIYIPIFKFLQLNGVQQRHLGNTKHTLRPN